jgi:hypothetical protein
MVMRSPDDKATSSLVALGWEEFPASSSFDCRIYDTVILHCAICLAFVATHPAAWVITRGTRGEELLAKMDAGSSKADGH